MEPEELQEHAEHAQHTGHREIGLTTAIVAVLLAVATLLGHREHTEVIVLQGESNDQWVNYDSKRTQRIVHEDFAELSSVLPGAEKKEAIFKEKAKIEREGEPAKNGAAARPGTDEIRKDAEKLNSERKVAERRANRYDSAELFLEISIVLCSIALLAGARLYWQLSFISTAIGIAIVCWGWFLR